MRLSAVLAALLLASAAPATGQEPTSDVVDQTYFWTACAPLALRVAVQDDDDDPIGLTEDRVRTMAESRLRAARLYTPLSPSLVDARLYTPLSPGLVDARLYTPLSPGLVDARLYTPLSPGLVDARLYTPLSPGLVDARLSLVVIVFRSAYTYLTTLEKRLTDEFTGRAYLYPTTVVLPYVGTHGRNPGFIMQQLTEKVDALIGDYVRVNESSCQ